MLVKELQLESIFFELLTMSESEFLCFVEEYKSSMQNSNISCLIIEEIGKLRKESIKVTNEAN